MAGKREMIAKNIAAMLRDGDVVNLGAGYSDFSRKLCTRRHDSMVSGREWLYWGR